MMANTQHTGGDPDYQTEGKRPFEGRIGENSYNGVWYSWKFGLLVR